MKINWRPSGKTNKSTWSQSQKELLNTDQKSIASLFPKDYINGEASYDLSKIIEMENKLNRDNLIYKTGNKKKDKTYDFQKFKTTFFGRENYNDHLSLDDTIELQIRWKDDIYIFKESAKPKESVRKKGYGFLSFAKNMVKILVKIKRKTWLIDVAWNFLIMLNNLLKKTIQKTAEANGDLIGDKVANKIKRKL